MNATWIIIEMALVTVLLVDVQDLKLEKVESDPNIFCLLQRGENFISKETTPVPYSPKIIKFNQTFKFAISNPLIDSILIGVFQNTPTSKYTTISNMKIKVISLRSSLSGKTDQYYPLYTLDNKVNGKIHLITHYKDTDEDTNSSFLLGGINSRVFIDFDENEKDKRKPADFNHIESKFSFGQMKPKQTLKPSPKVTKTQSNQKNFKGDTINNMLNEQKNKAANALLKKMKLDPVRLQKMSNYIAILNKNEEVLNNARKAGKIVDGLNVRNELDYALMSQIESSIEETEKLIQKVKALPVDDLRVKAGLSPAQMLLPSQSKSSRPTSRMSNGSSKP